MSDTSPTPGGDPTDNGLVADRYVPLADVAADVTPGLLAALRRARIAAYLGIAPSGDTAQRRLYVAAEERADARSIVAALLRADGRPSQVSEPSDPLAGVDTDVAFAELIADWHVDTHQAIREAERKLSEQDANWRARLERSDPPDPMWLDEEHYVPPPPPPLPRLAAPTLLGVALIVISVALLSLGTGFGIAPDLTLLLGVAGVIGGAAVLVMRLRSGRDEHDDDGDDGAVV